MFNILALLVAGAVLAAAGTVFAGEPTGRYQGAVGSVPQGVEQVFVDHSDNRTYETASRSDEVPAGQEDSRVTITLRNVGRALVATATVPGSVPSDVQLASRQ